MNTKIVYSLISGPDDFYLEQLILSVHSLRRYNPTAFVEVVTDDQTEKGLIGWRSILRQMVECINIADVPQEFNNMKRSRYLKTNLRSIIKGNYLFLDTDTIICGNLATIDDFRGDIMMVADCNDAIDLQDNEVLKRCETIGFKDMLGKAYYNSGVMLVKDSETCHDYYKRWYSNWLISVNRGINLDQPSLNFTNHQFGDIVQELPGLWNCQIFFSGLTCLHQSNVIHYAGGGSNDRMIEIYKLIRTEGVLSKKLKKYIAHPRTTFYMYLTSNDRNIKNKIMLTLNVKYHRLYNLIEKFLIS